MELEPAGDKGSYFQNVPFRASRADAAHTTMSMIVNGKETPLTFAKDFLGSADPSRPDTSVDAPVAFVGYGITSPELHHDDYQGIDAKGKIVALIYGAPQAQFCFIDARPLFLRPHQGRHRRSTWRGGLRYTL